MSIANNIAKVRERISAAAHRAGVDESGITLIAVTKTMDTDTVREAIEAGATDIGENYVQESVAKFGEIGPVVRWHMIGHLQTNKVRQVVPIFDLIHSVDSLELALEIGKRSENIAKRMPVLVEVNISGEESKFGVEPDQAGDFCAQIASIEGIELCGLMGMAPFVDDPDAVRRSFRRLRKLWEELPEPNRRYLSMGMTSDFEIAIEEGSNMVRVGTAIFGPRK
jgi:hypothetical protein